MRNMTKIDIFSGFLGAGKTTLIKKLIADSYKGEKLVLIENEFGEIGIDGGFLQDAGIEITEMNSGCICCSLVGDFREALAKVLEQFSPDRIIIEPSGVGKLSDVIRAVSSVANDEVKLNAFTTVVDAGKCKMYMKNFGEFFNDQVEHAGTIVMSHADTVSPEKLAAAVALVKEKNGSAVIVTTPITQLDGETLLAAIEREDTLAAAIEHLKHEHEDDEDEHEHHHHHHDDDDDDDDEHEHHHHHHDDDDDDDDEHEHHHHHHDDDDDDDDEHEHHHHHHHDDDDDDEHEHHHHHHDDDGECSCGCHHDHDHDHHHHHADEVFTSWGVETTKRFTKEAISEVLEELCDEARFGVVLRAKGIVAAEDGTWIHFDYTPGESDVRTGSAGLIGRLCVIGSKLNEENIAKAFDM
jgi:G3E family GTPase